jgi:pimeloyl-ACP methyl ester carboxylesterase
MKTLGVLLLLILVALISWKSLPGRTNPIPGPHAIAKLVPIEVGGIRQWLLIRGQNHNAPILLWLHGGPGAAQMPIHSITAQLEHDFVVVHWDQRGAGKSNLRGFDPRTMTFERFLADAREVTVVLRDLIGEQPIIVLGHSWGTMLGARLVARWPEDYAGYVGVGQHVNTVRGAELAFDWLRNAAPDSDLVAEAQAGDFHDHARYVALMLALEKHGGGMNVSLAAMLPRALAAPEYRLPDYLRWLRGASRGSGPMWPDYLTRDLKKEVPVMPVPTLLISGAHDMNTPVVIVKEWFNAVEAPAGKAMEIFDSSGHAPFFTETERFIDVLHDWAVLLASPMR